MKHSRTLVFLLMPFFILACRDSSPSVEAQSPEAAVVAWLSAVDRGDFEAAARMAPPSMGEEEREELARELADRFEGAQRDESSPFAMSDVQGSEASALVRLRSPDGMTSVTLSLEAQDGTWHVVPSDIEEGTGEP